MSVDITGLGLGCYLVSITTDANALSAAHVLFDTPLGSPETAAETGAHGVTKQPPPAAATTTAPRFAAPFFAHIPNIASLTAVVVSSAQGLLGLPYLVNHTSFAGRVLVTAAAADFGALLLRSAVREHDAAGWGSLPLALLDPAGPAALPRHAMYSLHDVEATLDLLERVSYHEVVLLGPGITASATPSGAHIGACVWSLATAHHSVVVLSGVSTATGRSPAPLDLAPLMEPDVLLVPVAAPLLDPKRSPQPQASITALCSMIGATIAAGATAIIPVDPVGLVFDLIETVTAFLASMALESVPQVFIAPYAKEALSHANIASEWLAPQLAEKAYAPAPPFCFSSLLAAKYLSHFRSLASAIAGTSHVDWSGSAARSPKILWVSSPHLRSGPVVDALALYGGSPRCSLILTQPDLDVDAALAPFGDLALRVIHAPLEMRARPAALARIIQSIRPGAVVAPEDVATSLADAGVPNVHVIDDGSVPPAHPTSLALPDAFDKVVVPSGLLAVPTHPTAVNAALAFPVSAALVHAASSKALYRLEPEPHDPDPFRSLGIVYAVPTPRDLLHTLHAAGLVGATLSYAAASAGRTGPKPMDVESTSVSASASASSAPMDIATPATPATLAPYPGKKEEASTPAPTATSSSATSSSATSSSATSSSATATSATATSAMATSATATSATIMIPSLNSEITFTGGALSVNAGSVAAHARIMDAVRSGPGFQCL